MTRVVVLRWGHRPVRDARLTTHVALAARAFGANGIVISDTEDPKIEETIRKIRDNWGGKFDFEMGTPWKKVVKEWKSGGGIVVHLTAYGENVAASDVMQRIKKQHKKLLIIVGSQKVPNEFYSKEIADFNVAIGNQPHSECASVAVFLDRFWRGKELDRVYECAKMRIVPTKRGKKVEINREIKSPM